MAAGDAVYAWAVAIALIAALFMTACASAPVLPRELSDASRCLQIGPCFVVQVESQYVEPVVIYVNGSRITELSGMESRPLYVRESQLVEGRCVYAVAVLRLSNKRLESGRQCIRAGGFFTLKVSVGNQLWLVAR